MESWSLTFINNKMTEEEYAGIVMNLLKPGCDILKSMTHERVTMIQLALGLAGEAGEIMGAVKKYIIYNQPLDYDNVKEELGDIEFFMEGLRQSIGVTRDECLDYNARKLEARYSGFIYSDKSAADRKDKNKSK